VNGIITAFQGFLARDPEPRYTQKGQPLLSFSMGIRDAKAEEGAQPEWVRCTVFGERADELHGKLRKGGEVYIEGRLKLNTWQAADGQQRAGLDVVAFKVEPMGAIGRKSGMWNGGIPRQKQEQERQPVAGGAVGGRNGDHDDDNLPF
jgi:single-strand DNA-binding protein